MDTANHSTPATDSDNDLEIETAAIPKTENCHSILRTALEATPAELRPRPPYHLDGPVPRCPAIGQVQLAFWFAELVADRVAKDEQHTFKEVLSSVREYLAKPTSKATANLARLSSGFADESEALSVARRAAGAAASLSAGKADVVFVDLNSAVRRVVRMLVEQPAIDPRDGQKIDVRSFLLKLDHAIVCMECVSEVARSTKQTIEVKRVLGRGDSGKGKAGYFIVELNDERFGALLGKKANRSWFEGTREEIMERLPFATMFVAGQPEIPESFYAERGI